MSLISGLNTSTCALAVMSIQTLTRAHSSEQRVHAGGAQERRLLLDVSLVPEREREQAPELPAPVLGTGDVLVEQPQHRLRPEEALAGERVRRERRAREGRELASQPGGGRDREPALPAVH